MLRNYFLLNIILLVIIGFLGVKFYKVYKYTPGIPEPAVKQVQKEIEPAKTEDIPVDPAFFQIIANMDIFRPSRSLFKEESGQQAIAKNPPRLFGTIILGNEKTAILEDPNTKSTRTYRVNEPIAGYVVSEILEDRVVLSWNGEKSEVRLREEKKGLAPLRQPVIPQAAQPPQIPQQQPLPQMQSQPAVPPVPRPVPQRPIRGRPATQPFQNTE
jgi:type II secretory pathway component PulC